MKQQLYVIALLLASANAQEHILKNHPVRQEIVDEIRSKTTKWKARDVSQNHFSQMPTKRMHHTLGSLDAGVSSDQLGASDAFTRQTQEQKAQTSIMNQLSDIFGLNGEVSQKIQMLTSSFIKTTEDGDESEDQTGDDQEPESHVPVPEGDLEDAREDLRPKKDKIIGDPKLPQSYDYRDVYPQCSSQILDQAMCGSCWAFSASGVLSDRMCIHSEGQINVTLSPQDMIDCDFENFGCMGGYMIPAIDFLITEGVTTFDCMAYQNNVMDGCTFRCDDETKPYEKYYCKAGSLKIETDRWEMQRDIYENGPVMVGLMVYEDLYNYESGIYEYTAGQLVGGHAIRAIGWGHDDDGFLYWDVQNQWTTDWGEEGYARIKAGELGIDTWTLSCMPDIIVSKID